MTVDVWLRGTDFAKTHPLAGVTNDPASWTDRDVSTLLKAMLLAIHTAKNPDASDTEVFLRGFSWIVNPYDEGGVLIALEIQAGAAVAGPFAIEKQQLEGMITRAIGQQGNASVH